MMKITLIFLLFGVLCTGLAQDLPTNYEYYTGDGITWGLYVGQPTMTLNKKDIFIYSGTMHYFRVPRAYWRDRLRKMRAAGLNTVESYIPWNLHEYQDGVYDWGYGGSELEDFLHLEEFLQIAQEEDLFVIMRPGPFICGEYNFGGFPSWLLGKQTMGFRTSEETYMKYVTRYFDVLLPILYKYQFTQGGPIITFQVENEYAIIWPSDKVYLKELYDLYKKHDIVELLVTSDNPWRGDAGSDKDLFFLTGNFNTDEDSNLHDLAQLQPEQPVMVMEYWPGWFDKAGGPHNTISSERVTEILTKILAFPASVNMYMFHGGTNFYFLNGASAEKDQADNSDFSPVTTSYDYDSPLNETGGYTEKFWVLKNLLAEHIAVQTKLPELPEIIPPIAYPSIEVENSVTLLDALEANPTIITESTNPLPFELLPINNNSGQSYGYLVYRKEGLDIPGGSELIIEGHVCDTVMVLINGNLISPPLNQTSDLDGFGYWRLKDSSLKLSDEDLKNVTLDLIVEEWGRINVASVNVYNQTKKGLWQGKIRLDDTELLDWKLISVEFKKSWTNSLTTWKKRSSPKYALTTPTIFKAVLTIDYEPRDTFIDMTNWGKGIVIVNGFVIGRHYRIGPQQSLYLPAPFLKQGDNEIVIFEHFKADTEITFSSQILFGNN